MESAGFINGGTDTKTERDLAKARATDARPGESARTGGTRLYVLEWVDGWPYVDGKPMAWCPELGGSWKMPEEDTRQ